MTFVSVNVDPGASGPLDWSRATAQLDRLVLAGGRGPTCWLATTGLDGGPNVTGVVGHWSVAISLADLDLMLEGVARRVTDGVTMQRIAWHLYALKPERALGVGTSGEPGATRWTF